MHLDYWVMCSALEEWRGGNGFRDWFRNYLPCVQVLNTWVTLDRRSSVQGCRLTLKHGSVVLPSLGETTTAWLGGVTHTTKKPGIKAYTLTNLWGGIVDLLKWPRKLLFKIPVKFWVNIYLALSRQKNGVNFSTAIRWSQENLFPISGELHTPQRPKRPLFTQGLKNLTWNRTSAFFFLPLLSHQNNGYQDRDVGRRVIQEKFT